uniref:Mast cell degranulating peptide n=1 Tax=Bombus pensylvanicus TaxID=28643 RepID=MCDP_BOMPE|nr:RecName: Full=Mast cell degranulating peptide; Short=MCD peptide; Short=MCDP [Bombus pensylvanicus]prf//1208383A mast cell degranulating peptide [Bombus sp.]
MCICKNGKPLPGFIGKICRKICMMQQTH